MTLLSQPSSWIQVDATDTAQLAYAVQTNPAPLTTSTSGSDPVLGSVEIVVTNPTRSALSVKSITWM